MKFKIILKTKNEEDLIELWIQYYIKIVGEENIIIFDNYSTNKKVLDIYKKYNIDIKNIDIPNNIHSYSVYQKFYDELFDSCDWFTVLDTDEFLCTYKDEKFSTDSILNILQNSSYKILGSVWLQQMHIGDSIEYFKTSNIDLKNNRNYGKAIFNTSYEKIKDIDIYGHNIFCKNKIISEYNTCLNSGLTLLHLDRLNPEKRINNCISMCLSNSSIISEEEEINLLRKKVYKELQIIKHSKIPSKYFLEMKFPDSFMNGVHKLREIQEYYSDKYEYIRKWYGTHQNYIRTNIINHHIFGDPYYQKINNINYG